MKVTHPFQPIYDSESKILILGSFPSVKSRENDFYYGNKNNRFWKVMSLLFDDDFTVLCNEEKKEKLLFRHIALYDVIYSCDIINSSDSSIRKVKYTNIKKIINESKTEKIVLNGKKAYELFIKKYPEYENMILVMPSTSPANAAVGLEALKLKWSEILKYL